MSEVLLKSLCLFLVSGHTFTFRNVVIMNDNETAITFSYKAMSDNQQKVATFYKSLVAGESKCIDRVED